MDNVNLSQNQGVSEKHRKHVLSYAPVWRLPARFLLIRGWEGAVPGLLQSGRPMSINSGRTTTVRQVASYANYDGPRDFGQVSWRGGGAYCCESYGLTNNPNFLNPANNLSVPATFGRITASGGARVVQIALRYEF